MLRSLFSGISGLRSHQTMMDVTGNNIANVNTSGFKSSNTQFQDTLSQLLRAAGAPQGQNAGSNPSQVGLGVRVAGVTTNFGQGSAQQTGRSLDLMVNGDGFFIAKTVNETLYTRAGALTFDINGTLITPEGAKVQGWQANPATGAINTTAGVGDIQLPISTLMQPSATAQAVFEGNLPGDAAVGQTLPASIDVYDNQGTRSTLAVTFRKDTADTWSLLENGVALGTIQFSGGGSAHTLTPATITSAAGIDLALTTVTGYSGTTSIKMASQDGYAVGSLTAFNIGPDGILTGIFSNGLKQSVAQIATATFANVAGLEKAGSTMYRTSANSGLARTGAPGLEDRGALSSGTLEMSNVDLAAEFTNLIIAQRGFQANSRVITSSDELLQDLVNLKR